MHAPTPPSPRRTRRGLPLWLARPVARAARLASRATGREGAALPGKVLLALCPSALVNLARAGRRRGRRMVLVSATNGKTTMTALLAESLAAAGHDVVHNVTGANLRSGIATTLLQAGNKGDVAVLETDEAALALIAPDLEPDIIVLGNLFRDQLDRFGELEVLADRWRTMLAQLDPTRVTVIYAADDPLICDVVREHVEHAAAHGLQARTIAYGLADASVAQTGVPHAADARFCRRCSHPLTYEHSWVGHLGAWRCDGCGITRPELDVSAGSITLDGLAATALEVFCR